MSGGFSDVSVRTARLHFEWKGNGSARSWPSIVMAHGLPLIEERVRRSHRVYPFLATAPMDAAARRGRASAAVRRNPAVDDGTSRPSGCIRRRRAADCVHSGERVPALRTLAATVHRSAVSTAMVGPLGGPHGH